MEGGLAGMYYTLYFLFFVSMIKRVPKAWHGTKKKTAVIVSNIVNRKKTDTLTYIV